MDLSHCHRFEKLVTKLVLDSITDEFVERERLVVEVELELVYNADVAIQLVDISLKMYYIGFVVLDDDM